MAPHPKFLPVRSVVVSEIDCQRRGLDCVHRLGLDQCAPNAYNGISRSCTYQFEMAPMTSKGPYWLGPRKSTSKVPFLGIQMARLVLSITFI